MAVMAFLAGCRGQGQSSEQHSLAQRPDVQPTIAFAGAADSTPRLTPTPTVTNTATPTPSSTPTPSPTPTPTAQPIAVSGNPRQAAIQSVSPEDEIPCGVVDILDFPLNPPDGDGVARGGRDFGVYRSRYEQYHTGEDWWTSRGRGSFGAPVFSIGHGRVTYAAPLGWGRDKGVVIIRHTFRDGRQLLSFYGHLDPPSITLSAGECVSRGQQVGSIGRPRTPPHLHFEIRLHMPDEPGGGYWWQDPTLDGWLAPSATIWRERMLASPGVEWLRAPQSPESRPIGLYDGHTLLVLGDEKIIGLNAANGEQRWSITPDQRPEAATLDAAGPILYVAGQLGQIAAFHLPDPAESDDSAEFVDVPELLWQVDLDVVGNPQLIPFPDGGLMMLVWDNAIGLSPTGQILWQTDSFDRLFDWIPAGDQLLLSTVGGEQTLWTVDKSGPKAWPGLGGGALAAQANSGLLFNDEGLFKLDPISRSSQLLSSWPRDSLRTGDVVALEDGGALLADYNRTDRRLIRMDATGSIIWQHSLPDDIAGTAELYMFAGKQYLITIAESGSGETISVYGVDLQRASLTRLFDGGTRNPRTGLNGVYQRTGDQIFLNIGGGHLVSLDLEQAAAGVIPAGTAASNSLSP